MVVVLGNVDIVCIFLELGVDVYVCMKEMKICLYLVVEKGYLEMVEFLLGNVEVKENLYRFDVLERVFLYNVVIFLNIKVSE